MPRVAAAVPPVVVALSSFDGAIGKTLIRVRKGELFAADDPAVLKWPGLFGPVTVRRSDGAARVEQATAAPGEVRGA